MRAGAAAVGTILMTNEICREYEKTARGVPEHREAWEKTAWIGRMTGGG
ncbi:MAG: hypothetical protein K2N94_01955 [Lachnospiraceae bacterium]|nr:hypothetical protein [Lachnospiraceae bacterium]